MTHTLALLVFNLLFMAAFVALVVKGLRRSRDNRRAASRVEQAQSTSEVYARYRETLEEQQTSQALQADLNALERERRALNAGVRRTAVAGGLATLVAAAIVALLLPGNFFFVLMLGGAITFWRCFSHTRKLRMRAKETLMSRLCDDLGLHYVQEVGPESVDSFKRLGLLPNFSKAHCSDRIHGRTADGHALEILDAQLTVSSKDSDSVVFSGLLIHVASESRIKEQVLIKKRRGIRSLNPFQSDQAVVLESDEFTAIYDVYAEDQIAARRLLTPAIMQKCVELDEKTGGTPQIAFMGGDVYIAIDRGMQSFEVPSISQPWTDEIFERAFSDLAFAVEAAGVFDHELQPVLGGEPIAT